MIAFQFFLVQNTCFLFLRILVCLQMQPELAVFLMCFLLYEGVKMKKSLVAAALLSLFVAACGEHKEAPAASDTAASMTAAVASGVASATQEAASIATSTASEAKEAVASAAGDMKEAAASAATEVKDAAKTAEKDVKEMKDAAASAVK